MKNNKCKFHQIDELAKILPIKNPITFVYEIKDVEKLNSLRRFMMHTYHLNGWIDLKMKKD